MYHLRMILLGMLDALIVSLAVASAYYLRFEFQVTRYYSLLPYAIIGHIILILLCFNWAKIYRRVWQYASVGELVSLVKAATFAEISFFLIHSLIHYQRPELIVPRSIFIISWALIILGVGGSRFAWRIFRDSYFKKQPYQRRTLIIGAGNAGVLMAKELKGSPTAEIYPVGFIDDDEHKWKLQIVGLPVFGGREKISEIVKNHQIHKIIIAIPSASRTELAAIIDICKSTKAEIKILPRVSDLVSHKISLNMIREVSVEDLLGRDPVEVDINAIAGYISGQVILVTGAGGSIGSELCRQVATLNPAKLLLLGHGENSIYKIHMELHQKFPNLITESIIADVQDYNRINEIMKKYQPAVVFHAAAHKHVPLMEANPLEAVKNNILGTKVVAKCAHESGVTHFVMISTDKAVNPTSIMGASKRVTELIIQGLDKISQTKFVAVRFGNVLGSRGSVVPLFKRQIKSGGPLTVTHPDMVRYFMTIPEAVQLVIQAGALAQGGEIFILDMGKPVKIIDLAKDLIRLSGYEPDVDIKIAFTGLRPGEKLFEELLTSEEGITATRHNRIFVGKPGEFSWEQLKFMLKKLEHVVETPNVTDYVNQIKVILKTLVPTYQVDLNLDKINDEAHMELGVNDEVRQEIHSAVQETASTK